MIWEIMSERAAKPEVIQRIKERCFPRKGPEELGLYDEVILPEMRGPKDEVWSLGGLQYKVVLEGEKESFTLSIKHHGGTLFLVSLSPPTYTKYMKGVESKDLAKEIRSVLNK
jgi:hypothetical protein